MPGIPKIPYPIAAIMPVIPNLILNNLCLKVCWARSSNYLFVYCVFRKAFAIFYSMMSISSPWSLMKSFTCSTKSKFFSILSANFSNYSADILIYLELIYFYIIVRIILRDFCYSLNFVIYFDSLDKSYLVNFFFSIKSELYLLICNDVFFILEIWALCLNNLVEGVNF